MCLVLGHAKGQLALAPGSFSDFGVCHKIKALNLTPVTQHQPSEQAAIWVAKLHQYLLLQPPPTATN